MVATHPSSRYDNCESSVLIDATRKHPYPPAARVPAKYIQAAQKKWKEYGFAK